MDLRVVSKREVIVISRELNLERRRDVLLVLIVCDGDVITAVVVVVVSGAVVISVGCGSGIDGIGICGIVMFVNVVLIVFSVMRLKLIELNLSSIIFVVISIGSY
jgi:hypothetical protein